MTGLLEGLIFCDEHQCPMLHVGDSYVCLFEHVDAHLGGRMVRDLIPGTETTLASLVFDDGHVLPLLCPHCAGLLHLDDPDAVLQSISGQYLVALEYTDGEEPELIVIFSPNRESNEAQDGTRVSLHLDSARQIVFPSSPPPLSRSRAPRSSRRRRRGSC